MIGDSKGFTWVLPPTMAGTWLVEAISFVDWLGTNLQAIRYDVVAGGSMFPIGGATTPVLVWPFYVKSQRRLALGFSPKIDIVSVGCELDLSKFGPRMVAAWSVINQDGESWHGNLTWDWGTNCACGRLNLHVKSQQGLVLGFDLGLVERPMSYDWGWTWSSAFGRWMVAAWSVISQEGERWYGNLTSQSQSQRVRILTSAKYITSCFIVSYFTPKKEIQ